MLDGRLTVIAHVMGDIGGISTDLQQVLLVLATQLLPVCRQISQWSHFLSSETAHSYSMHDRDSHSSFFLYLAINSALAYSSSDSRFGFLNIQSA